MGVLEDGVSRERHLIVAALAAPQPPVRRPSLAPVTPWAPPTLGSAQRRQMGTAQFLGVKPLIKLHNRTGIGFGHHRHTTGSGK